ncbi:MAG: hypothetical protein AB8G11_17605 [Saprospiraceae bacterium]
MSKYNNWLPHIGALFVMLILAFAYYSPALSGKVLNQSDNLQSIGAQTEIVEHYKKTGHKPLWTNSMFGGMPSYQILYDKSSNLTNHIYYALLMGQGINPPHTATFLLMMMMYILMMSLGVDWKLGLFGAIVFGLTTNNVVLFEAGHSTKIITTAYIPLVIGGVLLAFRKKYLLGGSMVGIGMAMQILANHVQMTYYMVIILGFLGIFEFVWAIKDKQLPNFAKAVGVIAISALLGVLANTAMLWTTYEYTPETQRGTKELTLLPPGADSTTTIHTEEGLDKDYIFNWSYGIGETMNLLVPNARGGSSGEIFYRDQSSASFAAVQQTIQRAEPAQQQQVLQQLALSTRHYWGEQPSTSGPVYFGAVVIFLFLLGAVLVKNRLKWWILTSMVFTIFIAWGDNFKAFNYFLVDVVPMFNKFRSIAMILGITNILAIILAIMGLHQLAIKGISQKEKLNALYISAGVTGGIALLMWLMGAMEMLSFASERDERELAQFPELLAAIKSDRATLLTQDALRSFALIGVAAGILWAFVTKKINWVVAIGLVSLVALIDLWLVDKRFISPENFNEPVATTQAVTPFPNEVPIQLTGKDTEEHYRVLDLTARAGMQGPNPYNNSLTSYFHRSVGGYHAAKLQIYQDMLIHHYFYPNNPQTLKLLGMMNTKYILQSTGQSGIQAIPSRYDLGNAWFVNEYEIVDDANAEMAALSTLEPRNKAVIQKKFADKLGDLKIQPDSAATITLTNYEPEKLTYSYNIASDQLALFSEVYYPTEKGWNMYIDNEKVDGLMKANYILRAMRLPKGSHTLEMRFEPKSYYTGVTIGYIASSLVLLMTFGGLFLHFKNRQPSEEEAYEIDDPTVAEKKTIRKTESRRKKVKNNKKKR